MVDALNRKSYCNNLMIEQGQPPLHEEFRKLNLELVPQVYLASLEATPTLEHEIRVAQIYDSGIHKIKSNMAIGRAKGFTLDDQGTVLCEDRLVVPKTWGLTA